MENNTKEIIIIKHKKNESILDNLSFIVRLCFEITITNPFYIDKNNLMFILTNFDQLEEILENEHSKKLLFLYFNRFKIHQILYDSDKVVQINLSDNNKNLYSYFYLTALIPENKEIIDYSYNIDLIRELNNNNNNNNKNNKYTLIITSKIIIELIKNFRGTEMYEETEHEKELTIIENENKDLITKNIKNIDFINIYDAEEIFSKKIDEIYIGIIKALIINRKLEDYENTYNIINQLDLENIYIDEIMYNGLYEILLSDKNYINDYIILNIEDLLNEQKINFYYILLKYILKNPIYIYQIPFLLKTKKNIIKMINSNFNYDLFKKIVYIDKIKYILVIITDSKYYYSNVLNGMELSFFNRSDYKEENQALNLQLKENPYIPLKIVNEKSFEYNSDIILNIFKKSTILFSIDNSKNKCSYDKIIYEDDEGKRCEINYDDFIKSLNNTNNISLDGKNSFLFSNYSQLIEFLEKIKTKMSNIKKQNYILKIELNILKEEVLSKLGLLLNIECVYKFDNNLIENTNNKNYIDKDILNDENHPGFSSFYKYITFFLFNQEIINSIKSISKISEIPYMSSVSNNNTKKSIYQLLSYFPFFSIIEYIKELGKHNICAEYIKELSDGRFISGGYDDILLVHNINDDYEPPIKINIKSNCITESTKDKKIKIVSFSHNSKEIIAMDNYSKEQTIETKENYSNIIFLNKKIFFGCNENGIYLLTDLTSSIVENKSFSIYKKTYRGAIKINDNIAAFTSNRILSNGEDTLLFYNINSKHIIHPIKEYSFILSINNMSLISIPQKIKDNNEKKNKQIINDVKIKFLFCACKKYIKGQKNGILLVRIELNGNDIKTYEKFYETNNFEVYCFCPIYDFRKNNILDNKNEENENNFTKYFFVGGYDNDIRKGLIKLYKLKDNKDFHKVKIIFINNIKLKKKDNKTEEIIFNGFKGPISCITQSSRNGKILITCFDENVYLFTEPNIIYENYII